MRHPGLTPAERALVLQRHPACGPRLVGDIGGTHARFALQWAPGEPVTHVATFATSEHPGIADAVHSYLALHPYATPHEGAIGIATAITGDEVAMTNASWSFSITGLQRELGWRRLRVLNDFEALALALPHLDAADLHPVGTAERTPGGTLAVIGPGTGLGMGGLVTTPSGARVAVAGEGGHRTLAACDLYGSLVLMVMGRRFGHVSAERALSGPGLVNLYEACCLVDAVPAQDLTPAEVVQHALANTDLTCRKAAELFLQLLASEAGSLALTLGARGGVFIGGGIVPRLLPMLYEQAFRDAFEAKGRLTNYLRGIPVYVITSEQSPALIGAAAALEGD